MSREGLYLAVSNKINVSTIFQSSDKAIRTTQLGIIISIVLVVVKLVSGKLGSSYALIADATESAADILCSGLLWVGLRLALKPADDKHPYGHGKAEPLAAILIGLFLIGAAALIAYHSIYYINTPHDLPKGFTLIVLALVVIIKESLFRYVHAVGKGLNSQAVIADAYHHRSDAISSIAAFIGILIALILGKGYEGADDWAALVAACIIVYNAINIIIPGLNEIMDSAPSNGIVENIRKEAFSLPEVKQVEKCNVRKMGFEYYVDMHIHVDGGLTVKEGHLIAHRVKDRLMASDERIKDALIHIEPD